MCGIAGKYNVKSGEPVSRDLIERMCNVMAYRGPDDRGIFIHDSIGLGHQRLSILDLSELGHQPMASDDGSIWITFNGEIYNFLELRNELSAKGYRFRSNCDTEVIINLYREYGKDCLKYLRGMFAFAIYDDKDKSLFLARDRIGKKPLFYFYDGSVFIFASEIKSILQDPYVKCTIDYEAFCDYFKYLYIPDPKTIYKTIRKLEPAHYLICSPKGISKHQYWDITFKNSVSKTLRETSEELLQLLGESVRLRMISDVPLGAFLSGGIDSSAVVALMAQQQARPVTTCSIGFDSKNYDEIAFARITASRFKTDHHEFTVKQKAEEILKSLAFYFDEPFADASAVPTYYVSKLARRRVTVALAGDGGDENFAGYEKYFLDDIENKLRRLVSARIRRSVFPPLSNMLFKANNRFLQKGSTLLRSLGNNADYAFFLTNTEFPDALWQELINDDTRRGIGSYDPFDLTRHYYEVADSDDHLSRILYVDLKTYLPGDILVKVDRMSMANSLEVRAPLLDHRVVEFAASIPAQFKFHAGEKKYVLKEAFRKLLPPDVLYRKKMGFSVPLAEWLRTELREFAHAQLFSPEAGVNQFFDQKALHRIWNSHQNGSRNYAQNLWALLMFELWYKQNF